MKTRVLKFNLVITGVVLIIIGTIASCSKSNGPSGPTPPSNPGGYDSSNQIQASALITLWPFNSSLTDVKGGMTATNVGSTFASGINGKMAYQGGPDQTYALYSTGSAVKSIASFTVAFWMYSPQVTDGAQAILQLSNTTQYWPELDIDIENYTAGSDSLRMKMYMENAANNVWTVAPQAFFDTAVNKWTHFVVTYNAASGSVSFYENGTSVALTFPYSPPGGSVGPVPFYTSDPGSLSNSNSAPLWAAADFSVSSGLVIGAWQGKVTPALNPGEGSDSWNHSYGGLLQNFRIYNTALNSTDVKSLYILEKGGF
jgi:Concanavalin A-like lectin/glucanases superfamily